MPSVRTTIAGLLLALILSPMLLGTAPSTGSAAPAHDWDECIESLTGAGASADEATAFCVASLGDAGIALAAYQAAVAVGEVLGEGTEAVAETTEQATEWTEDQVEQGVEKAQAVGERLIERVVDKAENLAEKVEDTGEEVVERTIAKVENLAGKAEDLVVAGAERLVDKAEALAEKAEDTGEAVVERTIVKVEAVAGKIEDVVEAGSAWTVDKAEEAVEKVETTAQRTQRGAEQLGEQVAEVFDEDTAAIRPVQANLGPTPTPTRAPVNQVAESPGAGREGIRVVNPTPTRTPIVIQPVKPGGSGKVEPKTGTR